MEAEQAPHHATTLQILQMFRERGDSQYGFEPVSQREHALEAAYFAEISGATPNLIVAALLHDVGHLLHDLPPDAPEQGIDDKHELLAAKWLALRFGESVVEPVRLHVEAKRYLCSTDPDYRKRLSPPSVLSLELQGGGMNFLEIEKFRHNPYFQAAVTLRTWDDAAKVPGMELPPLEHFAKYLDAVASDL